MSQLGVTIITVGAALVTLVLLVPSLRHARAAGDLNASAALTLGMGWLISLPIALLAFSGELVRRLDAFDQLIAIFPGWYQTAGRVAMVFVAGLAAALLLSRSASGRGPVHIAGLIAIVLWTVAQLASGLNDEPLLSLSSGALLACLVAATVLPRGRGAALGAGIFGVTLAIASAGLTVVRYDVALIPCRDVCTPLGSTFVGVYPNENLLGAVLVAAIPFAYLGFRGPARYWFAFYLAGMAVATTSRTAIFAAAITVMALFILRPRVDDDRGALGREAIAGLILAGAVFASVFVLLHHWDPSALTGRAYLWSVASEHVQESPWVGHGPQTWATLYQSSSEIPRATQDSTHNQWMDVLFVTGWVGIALLVGLALVTILSSGSARAGVLLTLAAIFMIGTTERAWSVGAIDLISFSLVALILTGPSARPRTPEATTGERQAPSHDPLRTWVAADRSGARRPVGLLGAQANHVAD